MKARISGRSTVWKLAALLVISGCVSAQDRWEAAGEEWFKRGASHEEFLRDKAHCEAESAAAVERESETDWKWATAQGVGTCLHGLGYQPWGERNVYDRARETVPMRR
jgi:hypothetical protein